MCRVDVHGGLAEQQRSAREEQAHGHQQGNEKGVGGGHGGGREGGGGRYLHIQCPAPDGLELSGREWGIERIGAERREENGEEERGREEWERREVEE